MPTYINLSNLIVLKSVVQEKYPGGLEQFRSDYKIGTDIYFQEDNELFSVASMNPDEADIEELISKGLHFDEELQGSDDFTILSRYGGCLWKTDWIVSNELFAWHKNANTSSVAKAIDLGNKTMKELSDMFDRDENPFVTIW